MCSLEITNKKITKKSWYFLLWQLFRFAFILSSLFSYKRVDFSQKEVEKEAKRLYHHLKNFEYEMEDCTHIAPLTLEINALKNKKNAILLAHSYQTPDIKYTVADALGDSYGLSKEAQKTEADIILFSSVYFMGETAKILNPKKTVLVPKKAGCSLADSITAKDVREMRKKYPNAAFVAYINTTAEVKAEVDVCCTSANAARIVRALPEKQIYFLPDALMGRNLQEAIPEKEIVLWNGTCVVHEEITKTEVEEIKKEYPQAEIIAHPECDPSVVERADFTGSTEQMLKKLAQSKKKEFVLLTECGLADRAKKEFPKKKLVGTCHICPYMKMIGLKDILSALKNLKKEQTVEIDEEVRQKAEKSILKMFEILEKE